MAGLALGLALLTASQVPAWHSDATLWDTQARLAPWAPRPLINLAVERIAVGDLDAAETLLTRAAVLNAHQPPFEQAWTSDLLEANWAVIAIARGDCLQPGCGSLGRRSIRRGGGSVSSG